MSNRRRARFDKATRKDIHKAVQCPDCRSDVKLTRRGRVHIFHDETCPAKRALVRSGRGEQVMVVRRAGQSDEDFAAQVAQVASELAPVRLSFDLYGGLTYTRSPSGRP